MKELYRAILTLKTEKECQNFLRDLCTINELTAMSERWQVAKRVNKGTSYRDIAEQTGSSTATITRVAYWLHHGTGGYASVMHRV